MAFKSEEIEKLNDSLKKKKVYPNDPLFDSLFIFFKTNFPLKAKKKQSPCASLLCNHYYLFILSVYTGCRMSFYELLREKVFTKNPDGTFPLW